MLPALLMGSAGAPSGPAGHVPGRRAARATRPTPRATPARLRARGITAVIPEPSDQIGHRRNRGSRGGRPVNFDAETYKRRNVVERSFNISSSGAD